MRDNHLFTESDVVRQSVHLNPYRIYLTDPKQCRTSILQALTNIILTLPSRLEVIDIPVCFSSRPICSMEQGKQHYDPTYQV